MLPTFDSRPVKRVDIIEIPTLITEMIPSGTKLVQGPQLTWSDNLVFKYPDAIAIEITSATPNTSAYFDFAKKINNFFIKKGSICFSVK